MIFLVLLYKNIPHPVYPVCSTTTTANWEYSVFHALLLCNNTKIIEKFKFYTNRVIRLRLEAGSSEQEARGRKHDPGEPSFKTSNPSFRPPASCLQHPALLKQSVNRNSDIVNSTQCRPTRILDISVIQQIRSAHFNRGMLPDKPVVQLRVDRIKG